MRWRGRNKSQASIFFEIDFNLSITYAIIAAAQFDRESEQ